LLLQLVEAASNPLLLSSSTDGITAGLRTLLLLLPLLLFPLFPQLELGLFPFFFFNMVACIKKAIL
jgi:hypothetical protein